MERRSLVGAVLVLAATGVVAARYAHWPTRRPAPVASGAPSAHFEGHQDVHPPAETRIRVEVLNATHTRGLGRRATFFLRDQGFDVVSWGTSQETRDTTVVIDRGAHPGWAQLVARAMGAARVDTQLDISRDVDVSVLVGSTWRPPAEPFHP